MSIEFMIRRDDVTRFLVQTEKKPIPEGSQWIVYLDVREDKSFFTAGGFDAECPVYATRAGQARMPLATLAEVVGWGWPGFMKGGEKLAEREWANMKFFDGAISYGPNTCHDDGISLACGFAGYQGYPPQAEIIVLSRLLTPEIVKRIGLDSRLPNVLSNLERSIDTAAGALKRYGVHEDDIKEVIEKALKRAEPEVAGSDLYRWCSRAIE